MTKTGGLPWPQVVINVPLAHAEETEAAFFDAGALSVTYLDEEDQPVLEPAPGEVRLWDKLQVVALFEQGRPEAEVREVVCNCLQLDELPEGAFTLVEDEQWERAWMDQFGPMRFGSRLWICPSHCEPEDPDAVNLRLDPGLAFGTGTHATTALCLQWLDSARLRGRSVLDFGCGSGVLAIAALLLGAASAQGTDIDPQAMQASHENALLNNVAESLSLVSAEDLADNQYDIIVANILFQPLCELKSVFAAHLPSGGELVMSGVLEEQADELLEHYADDFRIDSVECLDGWVRVVAQRR
ncbi:50S ribosomal protein L11 methyltransferase [Granulosicoccaceae sp. 1_MG-2023]|nr:50S ribosomal protein L11 methyltransferase [Granulosicoccaceae sp. 1_MG-2023]